MIVWTLGSAVTSLPTDQEVPDSIPSSAMGFLNSGESFHGMYGLGVSVYQCPLSGGGPFTLLGTGQRRLSNSARATMCGP